MTRTGTPRGKGRGGAKGGGRRDGGPTGGERILSQRVKTARGRKTSSTHWIERQLNDPYVHKARAAGYRSRAAFKLSELDARFRLLKPGQTVVDLGAAPGGWSQIAAERTRADNASPVIAVDLLPMDPLPGVKVLRADFTDEAAPRLLLEALGGRQPDVVLSDLAPETTGHRMTDHLRIVNLVELALAFSRETLAPGGVFLAKVYQGGAEGELLRTMQQAFARVRHAKPPASRPESPEAYVLATGFREDRR